jgi:hypothetical protein
MYGQATNFLIDQQVRRYRSDLQSWVRSVQAARTIRDAFRTAALRPNPSGLISGLSSLWGSEKQRASSEVEQLLSRRCEDTDLSKVDIIDLMRMCQGHWPRIYRDMEVKLRQHP